MMMMKAGNSGEKKYGVLIKFIRMMNGFQISNLNSETLTMKKI